MTTVTITETIQTVEISDGTTVTIVEPSVEIVTVGTQGPQGIQGPTGPAGGVSSFNARTGDVVAETDDYSAAQIDASALTNAKMVYVGSGRFASAGALTYAASGTHLAIAAQTASDVPLAAIGASSQTGNLQEWRNSSGTTLMSVTASGYLNIGSGANLITHGIVSGFSGIWLGKATPTLQNYAILNAGQTTINDPVQVHIRSSNVTNICVGNLGTSIGYSSALSDILPGVSLRVRPANNTYIGLVCRGLAGQTADHQQWQDNTGAVQLAIGPAGQIKTNQTSAGTTLGSVTNKMPVYNAAGTLVGYVPIYDSIT